MRSPSIFFTAFIQLAVTGLVVAQDYWQPAGLENSTVFAFAFNSQRHVFAATFHGVFRSTNNGNDWTQINSGLTDTTVIALAINPSDDVFAAILNGHIYRSTNGGTTWLQVFDSTDWRCLSINSSGHVFAGAFGYWAPFGGVFRSTDNGLSWDSLGLNLVSTLTINRSGDILASATGFGFVSTLYRSSDNGENWTPIFSPPGNPCISLPQDIAIANNDYVYWSPGYCYDDVFRSTDNGASWDSASVWNSGVWSLAMDSSGNVLAGTAGGGVFRSAKNGISWDSINTGLTDQNVWALAVSPDGYIFAGTESGVFRSVQSTTLVRESSNQLTAGFALQQNYPNPFNSSTIFRFSAPHSQFVTLRIFNVLGSQIASVVSENVSAGTHQFEWNAQDLPSGVYFYQLQAGAFMGTKKLILFK